MQYCHWGTLCACAPASASAGRVEEGGGGGMHLQSWSWRSWLSGWPLLAAATWVNAGPTCIAASLPQLRTDASAQEPNSCTAAVLAGACCVCFACKRPGGTCRHVTSANTQAGILEDMFLQLTHKLEVLLNRSWLLTHASSGAADESLLQGHSWYLLHCQAVISSMLWPL